MLGFNVFLIVLTFTWLPYCSCDFSDLVNISEIIENSTLLPHFEEQVHTGNKTLPSNACEL